MRRLFFSIASVLRLPGGNPFDNTLTRLKIPVPMKPKTRFLIALLLTLTGTLPSPAAEIGLTDYSFAHDGQNPGTPKTGDVVTTFPLEG